MPGGDSPPISVVLSWPNANTTNPELVSNFWWIWNVVTIIIITLVVIIRFWVKQKLQGGFSSDDYFMFFGYLATLSMSITSCLIMTVFKWNRHVWDALPYLPLVIQGRQSTFALMISNLLVNIGVKISILLFIKRMIVRTSKRWLYWTIWLTMTFVYVTNTLSLIGIWVECHPLYAWWNKMDIFWALAHQHEYHCWGESVSAVASGAFSLAQDFMIATLPIFVFRNLQIPISKKVSIIALFALGYL
jgi:hypothetical protein